MKLYKSVDSLDGAVSMFLVYGNDRVAVMEWYKPDSEMIISAKGHARYYVTEPGTRFKDAIDPVLIAEW